MQRQVKPAGHQGAKLRPSRGQAVCPFARWVRGQGAFPRRSGRDLRACCLLSPGLEGLELLLRPCPGLVTPRQAAKPNGRLGLPAFRVRFGRHLQHAGGDTPFSPADVGWRALAYAELDGFGFALESAPTRTTHRESLGWPWRLASHPWQTLCVPRFIEGC